MAGVSGDNMSRRPAHFTQRDATRLMRAALAAGLAVQRIEVDRDGKLVVVTGSRARLRFPAPMSGINDAYQAAIRERVPRPAR